MFPSSSWKHTQLPFENLTNVSHSLSFDTLNILTCPSPGETWHLLIRPRVSRLMGPTLLMPFEATTNLPVQPESASLQLFYQVPDEATSGQPNCYTCYEHVLWKTRAISEQLFPVNQAIPDSSISATCPLWFIQVGPLMPLYILGRLI